MNRALPDMLQCADPTVLERQQARMEINHIGSSQQSYFQEAHLTLLPLPPTQCLQPFPVQTMSELSLIEELAKSDGSGLQNGWPDFAKYPIPDTQAGFVSTGYAASNSQGLDYALSKTSSCPPVVGIVMLGEEKAGNSTLPEKMVKKESFKKRKANKAPRLKDNDGTDDNKRMKGDANEGWSKPTEQNTTNNNNSSSIDNRETSADTSKENSKACEVQKPDYIHVRARRGQATDSHSLAERVRREKISERMKYLQDLVPGCNKITGKAGMLDEIINYVQSLQRQVEFLSMKLAAVNPRLDFNIDNFFAKEMLSDCDGSFSTMGVLPELTNQAILQFNQMQQGVTCCGLDMAINPPDIAPCRTTSAPVSLSDTFLDSYFHAHGSSSNTWDIDLATVNNADFQHGRQSVFPSQPFTGNLEVNLKMEM